MLRSVVKTEGGVESYDECVSECLSFSRGTLKNEVQRDSIDCSSATLRSHNAGKRYSCLLAGRATSNQHKQTSRARCSRGKNVDPPEPCGFSTCSARSNEGDALSEVAIHLLSLKAIEQ